VGLPGLDGLSVLRKLAEAGVLRSTRVIMLTLRSSDAEVLEALELGAFDHVAKPFSVPVLLHRIARALDSLPA
jgi:DNA-binding response OmpR family regulator